MAIPEGWSELRLGDAAEFVNGRAFKPSDWSSSGVPIIRIQNLNGGGVFNYYRGECEDRYLVSAGDLLFSWSGTRGTSFGAHLWMGPSAILNQHIFKIEQLQGVEKSFFFHELRHITSDIEKKAHGGTGIVHITKGQLEDFTFLCPPLPEQKKIAAILSSLDETIAKTEAVIAQLQIVKKAMMEQLLTKGMPGRHTRFKQTEIGEIPEEWEVVPLGDLLDGIDAGWSPQCETRMAEPHEWGVLKVSAVSSGKYLETENKALPKELPPRPAAEVLPGDILLARANGVLELVGRTVFVHESRERLMLSDKIMRLRPSARIAGLFMHYSMNASTARDQILELTGGSHMRNISQDALRRVVLPVPSRSEQAEISSQLAAIELVTRCEDRTLSSVRSVKESLSSSLLSGEIRVIPEVA